MARQALVATAALGAGTPDPDVARGKVETARFFCEQLLPAVHGLSPAVRAGAESLYRVDLASLVG
jgi:hypothetical protein